MQKRASVARFMVFAGCACTLTATAFPPEMELKKAEKIVTEIMSSDVAAFKTRGKSAADVADAALKYAGEANGEAAKFLLLKGAFFYQVRAADYDGAKATIDRIRAEIDNVPDKMVADMLASSLRRVPRKHCGQLFDLLQRTQNRVKYAQELQTLAPNAKKAPADRKVHARMGELYALLGDWKQAVVSFAAVGAGKRADVAAWEVESAQSNENKKFDAAKAAEFWWDEAANAAEDLAACYRVHAAYWYRKAIADDALPGLKKTLAEKRIAEIEKDDHTAQELAAPSSSMPTALANSLKISMGRGIVMELVPCPAGTFEMGYAHKQDPSDVNNAHKVKISRKFWTGRFEVTLNQWCALMPAVALNPISTALGGMKAPVSNISPEEADDFCDRMTKKYGKMLPKGYVFRLPTEAEWEYACRADAQPGTPYGKPNGLTKEEGLSIAIRPSEKIDVLRKAGVVFDEKQVWRIPGMIGGRKKPNGWGIYDMVGNVDEFILDRIPLTLPDGQKQPWGGIPKGIEYVDATDPLVWATGDNVARIARTTISPSHGWAGMKKVFPATVRIPCVGFRVVAGPDLVKESQSASRPVQSASRPVEDVQVASVPQPPPRTLKLGRGADIEFVGCPAGSFMMGYRNAPNPRSVWRRHKVNFTRPFWLSKFKVTRGMWNAYKKVALTKEDQVLGGMNRVHFTTPQDAEEFCEWVTKRFRSNLPSGYVVRLPTNAEWEYALRANATDTNDPYVQSWRYMLPDTSAISVSWSKDVLPKLNAAGLDGLADGVFGAAVGTKRPNAWGLYDMLGNGAEYLLDRVDCGLLKTGKGEPFAVARTYPKLEDQDAVRISDEETDPLWWSSGNLARNFCRGSAVGSANGSREWIGHHRIMVPYLGWGAMRPHPFRLCIGPDLVKEKGFRK